MVNKTFILMIGLPGAGKSSWAKAYQKAHPDTFIIASDGIREELFGSVQAFDDEKKVWATFDERITYYNNLDASFTLIVDAGNRDNKVRKHYFDLSSSFNNHILIYIKKPLDILLKQNAMRPQNRIVPEAVIKRFYEAFEEPNDEIKTLYKCTIKE